MSKNIDTKPDTLATDQPVVADAATEEQDETVQEIAPPTPDEAIIMLQAMKDFYKDSDDADQDQTMAAITVACNALRGESCQIKKLTTANTKLTDDLELQKSIAKRQSDAARIELEKAQTKTHRPLEPGELTVLQDEIEQLKVENMRLKQAQQRPLVETIHLTREITTTVSCDNDPELSEYIADGWHEVPALCNIFVEGIQLMQRITLRRINQKPTQPSYTGALALEIDSAFDTQANRDNAILQPGGNHDRRPGH